VIGRRRRAPFFLGHGPSSRGRRLGQEAGGHLVGEAPEAVVDLGLDLGEAGGVVVQSVEQPLLHVIDLMAQRCGDLGQRRDERAGLGLGADLHVRLAGEGEQTIGRLCDREPQFIATFLESALELSRITAPAASAVMSLFWPRAIPIVATVKAGRR
jgi:hypothetical protein